MQRYFLWLEYDGTGLYGWQRQAGERASVQAYLEAALERFCQTEVTAHVAGRTDAGVHALAMPVHIDMPRAYAEYSLREGINFHLRALLTSDDRGMVIAVQRVVAVSDEAHARFSAVRRRYLYRIRNTAALPALDRHRVWHVARPLDIAAMQAGAAHLVGHHDFTTFRAAQCQAKSAVKTLDRLEVSAVGEEVHLRAEARSFLHHQVRNIAGTLKLVGEGRWSPEDVARALAARSRPAGGPTAPPQGLYFHSAEYGDCINRFVIPPP